MRKSFVSARQISLIVVGALLATTRANAQITSTQPVPPDVKSLAPGNVDMRTGVYVVDSVDVNIGLPGQTLDYERQSAKPGTPFTDNWTFKVTKQPAVSGGNYYTVQNQSVGHTFYSADGTSFGDASMSPDGVSQLQIFPSGSQKYFVYTMPDGTQITFNPSADGTGPIANSIVRPDGLRSRSAVGCSTQLGSPTTADT